MQVIKRDGHIVDYDKEKIITAIGKANDEVNEEDGASESEIKKIVKYIESLNKKRILVEDIQDIIEMKLMEAKRFKLAKHYIVYRYNRALVRKSNTTDESILSLIRNENKELNAENSNKNSSLASIQRDYIAGEVSKDLTRRILLPDAIREAHDEGVLHFHDMDYFVQPIFNCCLVNIGDMLENGTVMNGKRIESPKSFRVACIILSQIIANISSNQYGGQSIEMKHLGKYVKRSKEKYRKRFKAILKEEVSKETLNTLVEEEVKKEIESGVQTIQYQINTLMTTNGQVPFVTLFLQLEENDPYVKENAMIIESILKQRLEGIQNEKGIYVTPAYPKIIYVLDECNALKGGKYDDLTKLAVKCSAKRLYPDYISAKKMRELYEGNVFSPMGCRSFLSPWKNKEGKYQFEGRFNQGVVSINLPQIGILADGDEEAFWNLFDKRLDLCREALMCRHHALCGVTSDISPIHWQYGGITRLKSGEKIDKYLKNGYSTLSLGYIGLYEVTKLMMGVSHTEEKGNEFATRVMNYMKTKCEEWKSESGIGFALYGTPAESLCYRFAKIDLERFGKIKDVTDKGYYTNSYHIDVRENIDAFKKLKIESKWQEISTGGAISYIEVPNMEHNLEALEEVVKFMYDHVLYGEINTKSDYCHVCDFTGEILLNDHLEWECPQCGNKDQKKMNVTRRTCGYLGENFWNEGKTREIKARVTHL